MKAYYKLIKTSLFMALLGLLLCRSNNISAQIYDPVQWTTKVEEIEQNEFELSVIADIQESWHIYGLHIEQGGPVPTKFTFNAPEGYFLKGKIIEPEGETIFDPVFEINTKYFEHEAIFKQVVQVLSSDIHQIKGEVEFMVCNDQQCLPPSTQHLVFDITSSAKNPLQQGETIKKSNAVVEQSKKDAMEPSKASQEGLLSIFLLSFLSGLAALLTPCVFPMIPLTVSFFTKKSNTRIEGVRNAILYGVSIILIYVILGSLVTLIFGADALNALSTSVWFNLLFFILLLIFSFSFLGAFEIVLPHSWTNKIDARADKGGVAGIFFMAFALALVSFSCTGPIVGTLLVQAASEGGLSPIVGMLGFSMAIALPFALFAAFPGWLNSLPRSGSWLNSVKVVLGFLELALAFKFLSNADLVLQLHMLERESFLAIWIAVFGTLTLYLFGRINLSDHTSPTRLSVGRLTLGMLTLAFTVYLIPGIWGAPLKWISGFPPPQYYSEGLNVFARVQGGIADSRDLPQGAEWGPHDIPVFKNYDKGMAYAQKINKPILLDFTGYACVNCRKMEERVWSDPQVLEMLRNDMVLISLYVDDKRKLPEEEQYISDATGKDIKTIGNKWSDFQVKKYRTNAQPYYVVIDGQAHNLNSPSGYNADVTAYKEWLKQGIDNYNQLKI